MLLWKKMREMRNQYGLTQQQLSDKMNLERSTYANYENGSRKVPYGVLKKFAAAFNVTTDHVLDGVEDSEGDNNTLFDEWRGTVEQVKEKLQTQLNTISEKIKNLQEQEKKITDAIEVIDKLNK